MATLFVFRTTFGAVATDTVAVAFLVHPLAVPVTVYVVVVVGETEILAVVAPVFQE